MKKNYPPFALLLYWIFPIGIVAAQAQPFSKISLPDLPEGIREINPQRASYVRADTATLRELLFGAPAEGSSPPSASPTLLQLPGPAGEQISFHLVRYPMLEPELSEKFPGIVTLYGLETGKGRRRIRVDWTYRGFHAVVRGGPEGTWYVDPLYDQDRLHYQIYYRGELPPPLQRPVCGVTETELSPTDPEAVAKIGDCVFRSYQLAVATTGEYYANQGNDDSAVLSTIVTTVNRVNEVTEIDLAIRFVLVADNDLILFDNGSSDPYNDNSPSQLLNANTGVIDGLIGSANYDVGHVFSWNGSGLAALRSVCEASFKGAGTTQRNGLFGDAFYIDYVAHELGHQMGAPHTFNAAGSGSCSSGNRSANNSFEPGSGSTIMAYAGICSGANVQSNSDAYYHVGSILDIAGYMESGGGAGCAETVVLSNTAPTISAGADLTIPANTPFVLTATGSDPDGHPLSYNWEQYDAMSSGYAGPPTGNETDGPLFRSLFATADPSRYFPNLPDQLAGNNPTWEVLPTVARTLNFRVTARDGSAGFGCSVTDEKVLTVAASTGFALTQPTGGETWSAGSTQTVTWDVAGTGPGTAVDCDQVDILLSTDGGNNFNTVLAGGVANDGSQSVTVPSAAGFDNRIQVRSVDNVFFATSSQGFTISAQTFTLNTSSPTAAFCANEEVLLPLTVQSLETYAGTVSLSVTDGLPGSASAVFGPNPVTVNAGEAETVVLTINDLPAGDYTIEVTGDDGTNQRTLTYDITRKQGVRGITLLSPSAGDVLNPDNIATFTWTADDEATDYRWRLFDAAATPLLFSNPSSNGVNLNLSSVSDGTYFWAVELRDSDCSADFSELTPLRQLIFSRTQLFTPQAVHTICASGTTTQDYTINLAAGSNLTGTVAFQAADLPGGVTASFNPTTLTNEGSTTLTLSGVNGLSHGDYFFRVIASDADDNEELDLQLTVVPIPAAVTAVFPADGSFQTGRQLTFEWSADPGAEEYTYVLSENSDMSDPLLANTTSFTSRTITFNNFSDGTTVYWRITSQGSCGNPADSPVFSFTFGEATALPVSWLDFRASATGTTVHLEWWVEELGDNSGFSVERSTDGRRFATIGWVPATGQSGVVAYDFQDRELQAQRYFYRIRQRDRDGTFSYSPLREVRLASEALDVGLQPNPARDLITLSIGSGVIEGRYEISDAYGRVLLQSDVIALRQTIDVQALPPALYFLRYRVGKRSVVRRFVKRR